jgi:hypothetical protein
MQQLDAIIGELCFVCGSCRDLISNGKCQLIFIRGSVKEVLIGAFEGSPLLEAVTRERLVKTQQAGKGLAGAVVICELWRLAVAL